MTLAKVTAKNDPPESTRSTRPVKDIEENNENDEEDKDLLEDDPFPFFFDGRGIGKGTQTKLEKFLTSFLTRWDWLAIETNIATFDMSNSSRGFTFSLREVYYIPRYRRRHFSKSKTARGQFNKSPKKQNS